MSTARKFRRQMAAKSTQVDLSQLADNIKERVSAVNKSIEELQTVSALSEELQKVIEANAKLTQDMEIIKEIFSSMIFSSARQQHFSLNAPTRVLIERLLNGNSST